MEKRIIEWRVKSDPDTYYGYVGKTLFFIIRRLGRKQFRLYCERDWYYVEDEFNGSNAFSFAMDEAEDIYQKNSWRNGK